MDYTIIDIATLVISLLFLFKNIKNIFKSTRYLIYLIFFLLYVVPLFMDYLVAFPDYTFTMAKGFAESAEDPTSRILYDLAIIYCQYILLNYKKKKESFIHSFAEQRTYSSFSGTCNTLFLIGMVLPALITPFLTDRLYILYTFQWREADSNVFYNYSLIEQLSYIGLSSSVFLLFSKKRTSIFLRILALVFLYINMCIEGKRSILFFALLNIIILLFPGLISYKEKKAERRRQEFGFILACSIIALFLIAFSIFVKTVSRGYDIEQTDTIITTLRIDFFRDDRVRFAIYSLLNPEKVQILDYPGQTFFPFIYWVRPFNYILGKLLPIDAYTYAHYMTSKMAGIPIAPDSAWMTPTVFAELISNFSIIGVLIMPFLALWFAKQASKFSSPINAMIIISFLLIQMYAESYVMLYLEFVLVLCIIMMNATHTRIRRTRIINLENSN